MLVVVAVIAAPLVVGRLARVLAEVLADPLERQHFGGAGQGAGVAAAISIKTGQDFDRLDIGLVQAELRRQGARIA